MKQISENEIRARLAFDNPWWAEEGIGRTYDAYPRRSYFWPFLELVQDFEVNRAVILMGPRRVGKTVMVFHTIQALLDNEIPGTQILYLSLETPVYTGLPLERLLRFFQERFDHRRDDRLFVFFDEVQYLKDWEIHLKSLVDSYPAYRFVATGSAAAALRLQSRESGAGRFTDFLLPPLTFAEYIRFINREDELIDADENEHYTAINIEALNEEFINYLNYGGYPEAVFSERIREESTRYIKSDIIDKVLLRDLPSLYGISDIQEMNRLFTTLAYNSGNEVSLEALAQSSGVVKNTLRRYLEYLEAAFLIRRVHRIDRNARRFKRATSFKVYLTNPSMRAALFGSVDADDDAMGALVETAIFSQWLHSDAIGSLHYARWKRGEVDLVLLGPRDQRPNWATEIKWSDRYFARPEELRGLLDFLKVNDLTEAFVTTRTVSGTKIADGFHLDFEPCSVTAYSVGRNAVEAKTFFLQLRNQNS